jgi:hypothetical protein
MKRNKDTIEALMDRAKQVRPITKHCQDAAWILPDGTMLDHRDQNGRKKQHADIDEIYQDPHMFFDPVAQFSEDGGLRVFMENETIYLDRYENQKITPAQWNVLMDCSCTLDANKVIIDNSKSDPAVESFTDSEIIEREEDDNCESLIKKARKKPWRVREDYMRIGKNNFLA